MKCFDEETYSVFLDRELGKGKSIQIREHLKGCHHCRELLERIETENVRIKNAFKLEAPSPDLVRTIMDKVSDTQMPFRAKIKPWMFALLGIFVLTGLVVPYILYIQMKSTALFQNLLTYITDPVFLLSMIGGFFIKNIASLTVKDLSQILTGQIVAVVLCGVLLWYSLFSQKKFLEVKR